MSQFMNYPGTQPGSRGLFIAIILMTCILFGAALVGWLIIASAS